jgi:hypothetical protein
MTSALNTFNSDDLAVLSIALDDWLDLCEPGDDEPSKERYAHIARLRDQIVHLEREVEEELEGDKINPAACPTCHSIEFVQAQGWVFARYTLDIDEHGNIDFPNGATMEWDMCKPFLDLPAGVPANSEYLSCTSCGVDWWYLPPSESMPGSFIRLAS